MLRGCVVKVRISPSIDGVNPVHVYGPFDNESHARSILTKKGWVGLGEMTLKTGDTTHFADIVPLVRTILDRDELPSS